MAMTGYYKTFVRPRTHRPLSMIKYDPVGMFSFVRGGPREVRRGQGLRMAADPVPAVKRSVLFLEQKRKGGK